MKKFNWLIFTFLAFAIFACDDDDAVLDTEAPTIVVSSPTSGSEFNNDQAVPVRATVNDNLGLDEVSVWVTPPGGQAQQVFTEPVSDFLNDDRKAEIDETINLGTGTVAPGTYVITVQATDDRGNQSQETVSVTVREADPNAPTIAITSPETDDSFQAGSDMIISALVTEDMNLSSVNVTVMAGNETAIYDSTITEFTDVTSHQIQDTVTIPRDAALGTYTLTITAEDVAGNTVEETKTFTVSEPGARVTFTIPEANLPTGTTAEDEVFIAGEFANATWAEPGTDPRFRLNTNDDGSRTITLDLANETEVENVNQFKFGRAGGWSTVEVDANCQDIPNREFTATGDTGIVDDVTIAAWKDRCE